MIRKLFARKGSAAVFLAMIFVAFSLCIVSAILISRQMVASSLCESYGRIWTKAVLSEYDRNLLKDYGIMAYFGNEEEVNKKIESYLKYSISGRLGTGKSTVGSNLYGFELSETDNFREAIRKGMASNTLTALISKSSRKYRGNATEGDAEQANRVIGNRIVIDTLPSSGAEDSTGIDGIKKLAEKISTSDAVKTAAADAGIDVAFMYLHFGNHVTDSCKQGKSYFVNEWEYILKGSTDDAKNLSSCRTKLFLLRNALNLASIYKDPSKVELISTAAELITPGPLGIATQALIAEAWAGLEANEDIKALYENKRVPVLKSAADWKISLSGVLGSDDVKKKLTEEALEHMSENSGELSELSGGETVVGRITEGLNYDEYLMLMILTMDEDVRLLRMMDLVQINMKYRHYRDFNLMEYFVGVRFDIRINGKSHSFEDAYK